MKKGLLILITALLSLNAVVSEALDAEITVFSGWSFLTVDQLTVPCIVCLAQITNPEIAQFIAVNTKVDDSIMFGVRAGFNLNERAQVEGSFAVSPSHNVQRTTSINCQRGDVCPLLDDNSLLLPSFFFENNMVVYQYDANFVYHFLDGNVRPYGLFGVGGVSSDLENDVHNNFSFNFGAGAKFYFNRIGLRFEVNDHVIPDYFLTNDTEHNLQVQYGFVFGL